MIGFEVFLRVAGSSLLVQYRAWGNFFLVAVILSGFSSTNITGMCRRFLVSTTIAHIGGCKGAVSQEK